MKGGEIKMKHLKCNDVSGVQCEFVAHGETAEDTKAALNSHGMEAHGEMMATASDDEKAMMAKKMDAMMSDESEDKSEGVM